MILKLSAAIIEFYLFNFRFVPNPLNFTPSELDRHWGKMYPYLQGYDISKLALVLHAKELAKQLAGQSKPGVYTCCCTLVVNKKTSLIVNTKECPWKNSNVKMNVKGRNLHKYLSVKMTWNLICKQSGLFC